MKLERKNFVSAVETDAVLDQLERTMLASIAMMKRLRRTRKRSGRLSADQAVEQRSNGIVEAGAQA
jgi:hypothetical protein